jgi:cobalamin biosynthesis Mg chelatase CobN
MTKNETVDLLKSQLPGFYSVEQVINLIERIEEKENSISTKKLEELQSNIINQIHNLGADEVVDYDSAEFNIGYNNRVEIEDISLNIENLTDIIENVIQEYINELGQDEEEKVEENEL